jgi:hypothetical protein
LVVGDSQARSLGFGLERWGPSAHAAVVWNVATEGCGLASDGQVLGVANRTADISDTCQAATRALRTQVETFRPNTVIVLSSIWDTRTRKLAGWSDFSKFGDPRLDNYLRETYAKMVSTLSSTGAHVVWMDAPCIKPNTALNAGGEFELVRLTIDHLNQDIIAPVVRASGGKASQFDLDAILCPNGTYRNTAPGVSEVRADGVHFTVDGAMWFADTYGKQLIGIGGK